MASLIEAKAEILCRKNILICDTVLDNMNETRWLFEVESLRSFKERSDQEKLDAIQYIKKSVINILGLNLMPIQDEKTGLLRRPEDDEIYPLVAAMGREDFIKALAERYEEMTIQEDVKEELDTEMTGLDKMDVDELDEFIGDIEFVDDPEASRKKSVWHSETTQNYIKSNVLPLEEKIDDFSEFEKMFGIKVKDESLHNVVGDGGFKRKRRIVINVEPESEEDSKFGIEDG